MKRNRAICCVLACVLWMGCLAGCGREETPSFILGMDASCVPSLEAGGVRYYDKEGQEQDVFEILADAGINYIRVRVWNHPFDEEGHGYGGGNCDIQNALQIGKRATRCGMKLMVDFHYSDFWADPGKQMEPKAWKNMNIQEKTDALYAFTCDSLQMLKDAGVDVGMVQIGNETNGGLAGETSWENMAKLFSAGAKAVRDTLPEALVAVHFTNPEKPGAYEYYGQQLDAYQVDYDVFASSYYPVWHGSLENLQKVLTHIHETYGKQVLVAETAHAYTAEDLDFHGNTVTADTQTPYPKTQEGQAAWVTDVAQAVSQIPGGMGVFYWEGTWIAAGGNSYEENRKLWETYGSGWASSFAGAYDPEDAGRYYGGCAVENQAFFDSRATALESLGVFAKIRQELELQRQ